MEFFTHIFISILISIFRQVYVLWVRVWLLYLLRCKGKMLEILF